MNAFEFQLFKQEIGAEIQQASHVRLFNFDLPEGFIEWFLSCGEFFQLTEPDLPDGISVPKSAAGNCFQNSQLVTIENTDVFYYEGILRTAKFKNIIHHGFNTLNEKVLDVTYLGNKQQYEEELKEKEYFYFGVKIDQSFFENNNDIRNSNFLDNPLLFKYYQAYSEG